jgi:hypothetical protein
MKNDPLTGTLVGVLAVSVLLSMFYFYSFVNKTREIRQSQGVLLGIQQRRQIFQALIMDVGEYSQTHPAIDPLLEAAGLKLKSGATAPATKPANK